VNDRAVDSVEPSVWLRETITPWDRYEHGVTRIVHHAKTEYQDVCIADTPAFGRLLVLDGIVQSSERDEFIYHEALVQPAMFAVGTPRRVLVLGGGEGATLREVLRWPDVERALMIDIDGELLALARAHLDEWHRGSFVDSRAEVRVGDAVEFLATTNERFDVVISDMTDPVEAGPSTFCFTREFFAAVQRVLAPGGVVAVQAGPWSPIELDLHVRVIRTLRAVFAEAWSYPCIAPVYGRALGFAVASDVPVRERIMGSDPPSEVVGRLRAITPEVASGLLAPAPFVETAIAETDRIYTDESPPATHGAAGWTNS
jgi:spermidine synthase